MKMQKKNQDLITPEMVDRIIEEHYAAGADEVEVLLQSIAAIRKPEVDVEQIVADTISNREKLAENISEYEDELVRMLDLATVLSERRNKKTDDDVDAYVNYLLDRIMMVLPDIIEIIQLLKK